MNNSIGYGAEDDFRKLCTFSNVNAVKSDRDIYGWDYLIEVPPKDQISVSADLQQGVKQALVQIKATEYKQKEYTFNNTKCIKFNQNRTSLFRNIIPVSWRRIQNIRQTFSSTTDA